MNWLSEIEFENEVSRAAIFNPELPETDRERMARVLREFVMGVKQARVCFELLRDARQIKGTTFDEWFENMSDDAKALCVAARESSKELLDENNKR